MRNRERGEGMWAAKPISQPTPQAARCMRNHPTRAMLGTKMSRRKKSRCTWSIFSFYIKICLSVLKKLIVWKKPHNWFCYKISFWHQWVFACLHICICIYICTPPRPITAHNSLKSHSLSILTTDTYTKTHKPNRAYSYFHRNVPSFKIKVLNNRAYLAFLQETILEKRNSSSVA